MMQYYYRDSYDAENCATFHQITEDYPNIRFFQPAPEKAPWHVQAILTPEIVLNFWPHKIKGQRQPMPAVEGEGALRAIIDEAILDATEPPFDVIEASE
ncbi:MAG: hypothetical protein ACPG6L_10665 [Nereida ignava]